MDTNRERDDSIQNRTLTGVKSVINRALPHVQGVERMIVNQAVQMLYPRIARKIQEASENELREEVLYLRNLLNEILQEKETIRIETKKKKISRKRK